jgi:hypothetical protein
VSKIANKGNRCEECGGFVIYDNVHAENVCTACGLVQYVREPAVELYPEDFKPDFFLIKKDKPIIMRDYFGNPFPPIKWNELKKIMNPDNNPGPKVTPIECLSERIYLLRETDSYSNYWDEVRKQSGLLCDVHESKPYLLEDIFSQLFNFLFKISEFKILSPAYIIPNNPWTNGSIDLKRLDPNRMVKDTGQKELIQSHYPKKIAYTSKDIQAFWKDIGEKHKICRIYKHIPAIETSCGIKYDISKLIDHLSSELAWNDKSPGEPSYHHYSLEIGKRMKRYIKLNKYTKLNINYKFPEKDFVKCRPDTFGPHVWQDIAAFRKYHKDNNKTNKTKIPESTGTIEWGPYDKPVIADCGYDGFTCYTNERYQRTYQICLYVNEGRIRCLRLSPEAIHADSDIRLSVPVLKQLMRLMHVRLIDEEPEYERCTYPIPSPESYRKITGKYQHDYLGLDDEYFNDMEDLKKYPHPIASHVEGDDWFVDAIEQGNTAGGLSPSRGSAQENSGDDKDHKPTNWKSSPFTHEKFLKRRYRRCIRSYAHEGPQKLFRRSKEKQSEYMGGWGYETKCAPGKEAKADISECKGCPYAVESSFYERECDSERLPLELKWSIACYGTFYHIPYVHPYQVASNTGTSNFLEQQVKTNLN